MDYGSRWPALLVAATVRHASVSNIDGRESSKPDRGFGGSCSGHGERCMSHELLPRDVCLPCPISFLTPAKRRSTFLWLRE